MTRLTPLAFLLMVAFPLQAQQLSLFTQYREHTSIINPAALESDYLAFGQNITFGASYRAQWVGLANAPTTQTLRATYLYDNNSGISWVFGGHLINDQTGPTGFTGLYGRIAGIISGDVEYSGLVVGLSAGAVQYRVKASEIRLREPNDVVGSENQSQIFPDVGIGLYFYTTVSDMDYFYAGASVPQVFGLDLTFQDENGEYFTKRIQHFYGLLGFYKFFSDDSFIEPSVWVKYAPNAPVSVDLNLRYQMPSNIWIGTGVSLSGSVHLEAGFLVGGAESYDNFRVGYGFDYSFSSFGPTAGTSHEINLAFSLDR